MSEGIQLRTNGVVSRGATALGAVASVGAFTSAAACCVLPLVLGAAGIGAAGLAPLVPYHWPLTIVAAISVAAAWLLYLRRRPAGAGLGASGRGRTMVVVLGVATVLTLVSLSWSLFEAPLTRLVQRSL